MFFFFMLDYFDFVRMSEDYATFQNEAKRRKIENRNAFNIFSDDNINFFNSSSNSLHDFIIIYFHNRTLQNVTFIVNNRFSSKKNRSRRVVDFKNKRSLSSRNKWFYVVYAYANIIEIKLSKFNKNDKLSRFKDQTFKRFIRQSRVERHAFFSFFFLSYSFRVDRNVLIKSVLQKKNFFLSFELKSCWKTKKKKNFLNKRREQWITIIS